MEFASGIAGSVAGVLFGCCLGWGQAQPAGGNYVAIPQGTSVDEIVGKAAAVVPSQRQLAWQELEFTAFFHFTVNTFTDREWGKGDESESIFNPTLLDARQWVKVCKQTGMKMVILTAKHHDGFCLWPSKYTEHSVKHSPWRNGEGDLVREVSDACREFGLKFGFYLSPWDRHESTYGDSPAYNRYFENQLTELLSNYGPVAEVWFDGANGEGPNGKRQVYDWQAYYRLIRKLQPNAVIAIMGPDVRWVGTESGYGRETEWSVIPGMLADSTAVAPKTLQDRIDAAFMPRDLTGDDLGGRDRLAGARNLIWYPAEVDVSIRPGWFYHASEDDQVKSPAKLLDIYYSSIGRNAVLLLNIPPNQMGLISDNDVNSLREMRRILNVTFREDLVAGATVTASSQQPMHEGDKTIDGGRDTYWAAQSDSTKATLAYDLRREGTFDVILLKEFIPLGQRVESFAVDVWSNGSWKEWTRGTTIGYKRLLRVPVVTTKKVRLRILKSRSNPMLNAFGLYRQPPAVTIEPAGSAFARKQDIKLVASSPDATIHYTLDGKDPDIHSTVYSAPLSIKSNTLVKAFACLDDITVGLTASAEFRKALYPVTLRTPFSPKYPAGGPLALTDGRKGEANRSDPAWQGYEGNDLSAVVDLQATRTVNSVSTGFLQDIDSWIFFPKYVEYSFSENGRTFSKPVQVITDIPLTKEGGITREFRMQFPGVRARYVKVVARNIGICPPGHPGAGKKAWIFVDEISIE